MKKLLQKTIDLFLYSNFFIALCAAVFTYQTFSIFGLLKWKEVLPVLIFFATLFIYSLHRIIGFTKLDRTISTRRISFILDFEAHILTYSGLALLGMLVASFYLPLSTILLLSLPALLSVAYIVPIFAKKRRFRDLPYLKVFTVGFVWTWVCVLIPILEMQISFDLSHSLVIIEKLLFITAITIPFDIRDLEIDGLHQLKTVPGEIGADKTKFLSSAMILAAILLVITIHVLGIYSLSVCLALILSYLITAVIINHLSQHMHDYWYSGVLDGTILLQSILVIMLS
jgi:4-hydroxybenzoate polyprenyltransferase